MKLSKGGVELSKGEVELSKGEVELSKGEVELSKGAVDQKSLVVFYPQILVWIVKMKSSNKIKKIKKLFRQGT